MLCGVGSLLAAIGREAGVPGQHVYFSNKNCSIHLSNVFLNSGVRRMLERKDYCAEDSVFLTIQACIDRAIGIKKL